MRPGSSGFDRRVALVAEVAGELVDVQRDVLLLHVRRHLVRVRGDVVAPTLRMGPRVLDRGADDSGQSIAASSSRLARIAPSGIGQPGVALPPLAEVDQRTAARYAG